jgi:hypothetical protein
MRHAPRDPARAIHATPAAVAATDRTSPPVARAFTRMTGAAVPVRPRIAPPST